jgi:hypothetical protein
VHRGRRKPSKFTNVPRRPAKDRLKEPQSNKTELSSKRAPISHKGKEKSFIEKGEKTLRLNRPLPPTRSLDKALNDLIDSGDPPIQRTPKVKRPKGRVIFHKWEFDEESWNFKRSPRLKQLRNNWFKTVKGRNPFYRFKDLFKNVKINTLGMYNRLKALLDRGLLVTTRSIGVGIKHPLRRISSPSIQDVEFIISKLPFWVTSYKFSEISKIAFLVLSQMPCGKFAKFVQTQQIGLPTGPTMSVVRTPRTNRHKLERSLYGSLCHSL